MYSEMLEEMIKLLIKSDNKHWANWFQIAYDLQKKGNESLSYSKVLGAYGGMGSFNDVFWNLPKEEHDRLEYLKGEIWSYAKNNLN